MDKTAGIKSLDFIRNEVAWLRQKWQAFRRISIEGENDEGALGKAVPHFFGVVQRALQRDTAQTVFRLVEEKSGTETMGQALARLKNYVKDSEFKRLNDSLGHVRRAVDAAHLVEARHEIISHTNQEVALGLTDGPKTGLQDVEDIVCSISVWMIELHRAVGIPYSFDDTALHEDMDRMAQRLREE